MDDVDEGVLDSALNSFMSDNNTNITSTTNTVSFGDDAAEESTEDTSNNIQL